MNYKFKCKKCGHDVIEEVLSNVYQYSKISDIEVIDGALILDYSELHTEGGELSHYQCFSCGENVSEEEIKECKIEE
jgi:predicted RNA-binding Zn-ribbon protein involved in translation (DUF1610 family)